MLFKNVPLWEDGEYKSKDKARFIPTLSMYILDGAKRRPAVMVLPGGGYYGQSHREAECVAMQFCAAGYHAFVLYYSCVPCYHPQPISDASRAMCIIREHADEYNIDPDKIAVCGFSAGGHLTASLGVHWNKDYLLDIPRMEPGKNKPNALILSYPVISYDLNAHHDTYDNLTGDRENAELMYELSLENHVGEHTPQSFIWQTAEDITVPVKNSLRFANALNDYKIPFEMHIYPFKAHGISLATEETAEDIEGFTDPHIATWMPLCLEWLKMIF